MDGVPIHQHLLRDASDKQGQAIRFQHIDSFCRGSAVQFFTMSMALSGGNLLFHLAFAQLSRRRSCKPSSSGSWVSIPLQRYVVADMVPTTTPEIGWRHIKRSHSAGSASCSACPGPVRKKARDRFFRQGSKRSGKKTINFLS